MVHTLELESILTKHHSDILWTRYNLDSNGKFDFHKYISEDWIRIKAKKCWIYEERHLKIEVFVDVVKLLGRINIHQHDGQEIIDNINKILLGIFFFIPKLKLIRIDYRFDIVIEDLQIRKLLIKLYNKSEDKKAYMNKISVFNYHTRTANYKTSIRYANKSRSCNVYDKQTERNDKNMFVNEYERNVLRFEAQVKRRHIAYNKRMYGINDSFEAYFTSEMYNYFMERIVLASLLGDGDYYNIYYASKIIKQSNFREKDKKELIEF